MLIKSLKMLSMSSTYLWIIFWRLVVQSKVLKMMLMSGNACLSHHISLGSLKRSQIHKRQMRLKSILGPLI